jgi:type II secretory pathway pseudopilin PulG
MSSRVIYFVSILTILVAAALIIFAIVNAISNSRQQVALDEQTKKTNQLIEEVQKQTEKNKEISQQAANYAYCNAVLLAQYTQTLRAITIEDLNNCVLNSFPDSTITQPDGTVQNEISGNTSPAPTQPLSSPANANATAPTQGGNSPQPATPAEPIQGGVSTTPTNLLPGINITVPCINATPLLAVGCR